MAAVRNLEHRDLLAAVGIGNTPEHIGEDRIVHERAAASLDTDAVALMPIDEMRRGMNMHAQAARLEKRAAEGRHRALAVGAGDMDHRR